ncbi:hypothetical protein EBZ35_01765 [bacterium]|nr:hypothetical protein [bacterium]
MEPYHSTRSPINNGHDIARRTVFGTRHLEPVGGPTGDHQCLWPDDVPTPGPIMTRRVRVGYAPHPPFSFTQSNGTPSGESWVVAHTLLTRLGLAIEPVETDFWSLIPQLLAGQVDVVASGLLISPEREKEVAFTYPTYQDGEGVLLHRRNPHHIQTFQDILTHQWKAFDWYPPIVGYPVSIPRPPWTPL